MNWKQKGCIFICMLMLVVGFMIYTAYGADNSIGKGFGTRKGVFSYTFAGSKEQSWCSYEHKYIFGYATRQAFLFRNELEIKETRNCIAKIDRGRFVCVSREKCAKSDHILMKSKNEKQWAVGTVIFEIIGTENGGIYSTHSSVNCVRNDP